MRRFNKIPFGLEGAGGSLKYGALMKIRRPSASALNSNETGVRCLIGEPFHWVWIDNVEISGSSCNIFLGC